VSDDPAPAPHRRRPRYSGKNPRRFEQKYKELGATDAATVAKVLASGKTPAGTHRPIMVQEILELLRPATGNVVADCTLGYGGHALELLKRITPGGRLIALDLDPIELPKTEARLRGLGYGPELFTAHLSNYAGLAKILATHGLQADAILADLGLSSMQIDDPARGFSVKEDGPLDMRMNPQRGQPASEFLRKTSPEKLAVILHEHADEPRAELLARVLASRSFETTAALREAIAAAVASRPAEECALTIRRVFQAIRIAVNDEFSALDAFLRLLPECLAPGGRVAILTFHSGEDRRVKKAFEHGLRERDYGEIAHDVIRPSAAERRENLRSGAAKLRWATKAV
jgi:16S rRNA (cytosine1402-N4)-methyltransferase